MKDWILTIGIDKFYLTKKQADFYLQKVGEGAKYVAFDENKVLGVNFQTLVNSKAVDETKALSEGKWECETGKWHSRNAKCYCTKKWILRGGSMVEVDKDYLLQPGEEETSIT